MSTEDEEFPALTPTTAIRYLLSEYDDLSRRRDEALRELWGVEQKMQALRTRVTATLKQIEGGQ